MRGIVEGAEGGNEPLAGTEGALVQIFKLGVTLWMRVEVNPSDLSRGRLGGVVKGGSRDSLWNVYQATMARRPRRGLGLVLFGGGERPACAHPGRC